MYERENDCKLNEREKTCRAKGSKTHKIIKEAALAKIRDFLGLFHIHFTSLRPRPLAFGLLFIIYILLAQNIMGGEKRRGRDLSLLFNPPSSFRASGNLKGK